MSTADSGEDSPRAVRKSALYFLSGTFLSRVTGLAREIATASFFGVAPAIAAFFVALRFANLLRRLLGEGSLLAGFSPHFEAIRKESSEKAAGFFRDLFFSLTLILITLIGIGEIVLFALWKWSSFSIDSKEIIYLTMLILPGVLFVCLYALFSALLQSEKKYFISGAAPLMFNVVFLLALSLVRNWPLEQAAIALSLAVIASFFFQWAMVIPGVWRYLQKSLDFRKWRSFELFSVELKQMVVAMALTILGVAAVQINSALDALFARYADLSGPAYLYYAMRLYQFPLSLFGVALASALLPPLARAAQGGDLQQFRKLTHYALTRTFSLMLPCTFAILTLGAAAVALVYGRGHFDALAVGGTSLALWSYGIGLVPSVFVLVLAPAFYAHKDYKTPLWASLYSVLLSTLLNALFVFGFGWGASSVAISTSLAAAFNCFYLLQKLSSKIGPLFDRAATWSFAKTALSSLIAGGGTLAVGHFLMGDISLTLFKQGSAASFPQRFFDQALQFFVLAGSFGLILFSYAWMIGAEDLLHLVGLKKAKPTEEKESA